MARPRNPRWLVQGLGLYLARRGSSDGGCCWTSKRTDAREFETREQAQDAAYRVTGITPGVPLLPVISIDRVC